MGVECTKDTFCFTNDTLGVSTSLETVSVSVSPKNNSVSGTTLSTKPSNQPDGSPCMYVHSINNSYTALDEFLTRRIISISHGPPLTVCLFRNVGVVGEVRVVPREPRVDHRHPDCRRVHLREGIARSPSVSEDQERDVQYRAGRPICRKILICFSMEVAWALPGH